jgi:hypothetical protein
MDLSDVKPPTQVAGVVGIEAVPITMNEPPARPAVDWGLVAALPPFQMFLAERAGPDPTGLNSHAWALKSAHDLAAVVGDGALFNEYAAWHGRKGYWPGETPLGVAGG